VASPRLSDCRCAIEHVGVGGKPRVRIAQIGRDRPETGHVERLRIRQVRDLRRDKVKDAGRRDEFTRLEQRSQVLIAICLFQTGLDQVCVSFRGMLAPRGERGAGRSTGADDARGCRRSRCDGRIQTIYAR